MQMLLILSFTSDFNISNETAQTYQPNNAKKLSSQV